MTESKSVDEVMDEFINLFDEYLFIFDLSLSGFRERNKFLKKNRADKKTQIWIASGVQSKKPVYHARMNVGSLINKTEDDGEFTTTLAKSLLCMMYCAWDEIFRHRIAKSVGCDSKTIFCPLMGDLRKVRHCILHWKSLVPEEGMQFEILPWSLDSGELKITSIMFRDFNDLVRGSGMKIRRFILAKEIEVLLPFMTNKERSSFNDFYKDFNRKVDNSLWPGMNSFLNRVIKNPEAEKYANELMQEINVFQSE